MSTEFRILLYYLYTPIPDPEEYASAHRALCEELGLRGRILIASEGINGTVSGTKDATDAYRERMAADPLTAEMVFKVDPAADHAFPKLSVKVRPEVVSLSLENDFSPRETTGAYLSPQEWREMMERDDVVLLDARNDYEWELGRFEGALLPEVESFRELPEWIDRHRDELEGKKILTYCTGGIRCEKFSGFLRRRGFPEVYQLHGGIVTYGKDPKVRGEKFEGKCYVFDDRVGVEVNRAGDARIVGRCQVCGEPWDVYRNCAWSPCNRQYFCCDRCYSGRTHYCGDVCRHAAVLSQAAEDNDEAARKTRGERKQERKLQNA